MAWRMENQICRGEIDSRVRGRVTGRLWLVGRAQPVVLDLEGDPWRDLAGHLLRFSNPDPNANATGCANLSQRQEGSVGDMTASRKVKVLECSVQEMDKLARAGQPVPWHWGNALYLEWFSERNGRVVVESSRFELELEPEGTWEMSDEEESVQRLGNANALTAFTDRLVTGLDGKPTLTDAAVDDDAPQSAAEAQADDEAARMNLWLDRVTARLEREGGDGDGLRFDQVLEEERERLRRERGEPEAAKPTTEEAAEHDAWIAEMNAAADEAVLETDAEAWKKSDHSRPRRHPLVKRCSDFSLRLLRDAKDGGWIGDSTQSEHPLREIIESCMVAGAKLAGALNQATEEGWPPPKLLAGNTLVRLKKARDLLRDALRGLDSADEGGIAPIEWRSSTRREVGEILEEVQEKIFDARQILANEGDAF